MQGRQVWSPTLLWVHAGADDLQKAALTAAFYHKVSGQDSAGLHQRAGGMSA